MDTLTAEGARVAILEYAPAKVSDLQSQTDPARVKVIRGDAGIYESNREVVDMALAKGLIGRVVDDLLATAP